MSWLCYKCETVNPNLDSLCKWCFEKRKTVSRLVPYDDYNSSFLYTETSIIILVNQINLALSLENNMSASDTMTREEKLFAKFFNDEKILVSQMDDFTLKAHIEELQDIAREARARMTCATGEDRERSATKKSRKGISATVENDDFTSEAINNIQKRAQKMSKTDKEIERLVGMGISREDAENMYRATTINKVQKEGAKFVVDENKRLDIAVVVNSVMNPNPADPDRKGFVNPFAPKSQEKPATVKSAIVESTAIEILPVEPAKIEVEGLAKSLPSEVEKPKFVNPFAAK